MTWLFNKRQTVAQNAACGALCTRKHKIPPITVQNEWQTGVEIGVSEWTIAVAGKSHKVSKTIANTCYLQSITVRVISYRKFEKMNKSVQNKLDIK